MNLRKQEPKPLPNGVTRTGHGVNLKPYSNSVAGLGASRVTLDRIADFGNARRVAIYRSRDPRQSFASLSISKLLAIIFLLSTLFLLGLSHIA